MTDYNKVYVIYMNKDYKKFPHKFKKILIKNYKR
jgi:hypothetical protein